jgi:hypothetical protein
MIGCNVDKLGVAYLYVDLIYHRYTKYQNLICFYLKNSTVLFLINDLLET